MRLNFTDSVEADFEEIGDYIAQDNPRRAERFINELIDQAEKVVRMPGGYAAREDLAPGLRMCTHGRYILFFRVIGTVVRIERVLHGRRDIGTDDF